MSNLKNREKEGLSFRAIRKFLQTQRAEMNFFTPCPGQLRAGAYAQGGSSGCLLQVPEGSAGVQFARKRKNRLGSPQTGAVAVKEAPVSSTALVAEDHPSDVFGSLAVSSEAPAPLRGH